MKKIIITLLLFISCNSRSEEILEHWICRERFGAANDILVEAQVMEHRVDGRIHVAGVAYDTAFKIQGFHRRWDFGDCKFAFIIQPNGDATYYDFSHKSTATPGMRLHCVQE